jgi:hypothetical protein
MYFGLDLGPGTVNSKLPLIRNPEPLNSELFLCYNDDN